VPDTKADTPVATVQVLQTLDVRLSDQQRQLQQLRDQIAGRVSLPGIEPQPPRNRTFWEQADPSLVGTLIGAALAICSSWLFAFWSNKVARREKHQDLTVQIIQQYLSAPMQKLYAATRGFLDPEGHASLHNVENRNQVVAMLGFFRYVQALRGRHQLDEELVKFSQIDQHADEFLDLIRCVDVTVYPSFAAVQKLR
jgi:hypothetical protein